MADINLCGQFPSAPDVSVCADASEYDVWLREQFPAAPDFSIYIVQMPLQQMASGYAALVGSFDVTLGLATLSARGINPDAVVVGGWPRNLATTFPRNLARDLARAF